MSAGKIRFEDSERFSFTRNCSVNKNKTGALKCKLSMGTIKSKQKLILISKNQIVL